MAGEIRSVPLDSLITRNSRYHLGAGPSETAEISTQYLADSMAQIGLQTPLLAHDPGSGEIHLLDGFLRAAAARKLGWEAVDCAILPPETPSIQILLLHASVRRENLSSSLIMRVRFVRLARELGVDDDTICMQLMPILGLDPHGQVLKRCKAIGELPDEILDFCDEKRFALKQCFHLTRHPPELLETVFSWRDRLSLTASILEELLENLKDHLRATRQDAKSVGSTPELQSLLTSDLNPQEKTKRVSEWVRRLRFPVLTETNEQLESLCAELSLPSHIRISWDRTLEHRRVDVAISARNADEWESALETLRKDSLSGGITELLAKM